MDLNPQTLADAKTTGSLSIERDGRPAPLSFRIWALVIAIPALCSGLIVTWLLFAAHTDMNVPVVYQRDALEKLSIFKGIGEGNLPWRNGRLAAPFGSSDWRDYPLYQWLDYSAFRFLSLFTSNYSKLLNWYWILTIVATAATAAFCFLWLRASPVVAGCLAFLYAMQPYVFVRNISHINLLCYLVPLLATACLEVAVGRWEKGKSPALREIPMYGWLGFLLQGLSFFYLSVFGGFLLLVAGLYGACRRRTVRPLIHSAGLLSVLVAASVIGVSPTLLHWLQHGTNAAAVERSAAEAEVHGLKIRYLLTPIPAHPLSFMRKLSEIAEAKHHDATEATTTRLGLLGAIGFVALIVYIFAVLAGWRLTLDDGLVTACAALVLAALLWCTVGGFGSIFNTFVSPVIRAYDRIIVFLVFFILAAYGALVSKILARKPWAGMHPMATAVILLCITTAAFADVLWIPSGIQTPEARQTAASDRTFVSTIERALGGRGMVFEIPYTEYPGGDGPGKMLPYDQARPYVQSSGNLQWSWGTVAGTEEARWMRGVAQLPPDSLIAQLQKKGFRGLWIDSYGYADNMAAMPAKALAALLGQEPLTSPDGRYVFFDLGAAHGPLPAPSAVESASLPFQQSAIHAGSMCSIDSINEEKVSGVSGSAQRAVPFHINGWVANIDSGVALPDVYVEISSVGGKRFYLHGSRYARGDVATHFNKPSVAQSGFVASGEVSALPPGSYQLRILQAGAGAAESCASEFRLELR
jgi:phosphoglycerol transferase